MLTLVLYFSFLSVTGLVLWWLVFYEKTCWFGAFFCFCTAESSRPSPPSPSFSVDRFMHAYGVRCRQGCWYNRFVSFLCFKNPPVKLTACHFRQILQSVTFLQKWNHRTLRIKWFHILFSSSCVSAFRLLCRKPLAAAPAVCKKRNKIL